MLILLDAGYLWLIVHPGGGPQARNLRQWLKERLEDGHEVSVPEISDYEARRELIRRGARRQLANLDALIESTGYLALDTPSFRKAAEFWARLRTSGAKTAPDESLDGDVILGAQADIQRRAGRKVVIATGNARHLSRLGDAREWRDIR